MRLCFLLWTAVEALDGFSALMRRVGGGRGRSPLANRAALEDAARAAARSGENDVLLQSIQALEASDPCDPGLLDDESATVVVPSGHSEAGLAMGLDGRWRLIGTLAAVEGRSLESDGQRSVVNASGVRSQVIGDSRDAHRRSWCKLTPRKTHRSRCTRHLSVVPMPPQAIDVPGRRISNEVRLSLPLLGDSYVRVSGSFVKGDNARQAIVIFDRLELFDAVGARLFENDWLFALVRALKPDVFTGSQASAAWLETTYLSDTLRVGRGNKGSCFILERDSLPSPLR